MGLEAHILVQKWDFVHVQVRNVGLQACTCTEYGTSSMYLYNVIANVVGFHVFKNWDFKHVHVQHVRLMNRVQNVGLCACTMSCT